MPRTENSRWSMDRHAHDAALNRWQAAQPVARFVFRELMAAAALCLFAWTLAVWGVVYLTKGGL